MSGKSLNAWVTEQLQAAAQRVVVSKLAGKKAGTQAKSVKKVTKRQKGSEQHV